VATHRYRDFPFLFTPYWWNKTVSLNPFRDLAMRERAHGDSMMVSSESPEAMEEMLWMAFFPDAHDAAKNQVLDAAYSNPAFERFYREHLQKMLLIRKGKRYVSKANYNLTRMSYLQKLFPDARFIIPIREPAAHIASLMRQHQRFSEAGRKDSRVVEQMSVNGHFEFGLKRTPINVGDVARMREIQTAWDNGQEVRGWALYWDMLYGFVHRQLQNDPVLKAAAMIVRLEDMSRETIAKIWAHCGLEEDKAFTERFSAALRAPKKETSFSASDQQLIADLTSSTAKLFGY
jgi:hypothetical protein